ncbi:hypothetical protein EV1_002677 [Malus domestica]|uniref:Uncharacterized protein n=1 Tax=Malus domestica TaxID=3750 RepID=A0A498IX52_MALDO|nr:hypothetical protein DVH24_037563 [Malus domestica]
MNSADSVFVPKPSSKLSWLSAPTSLFLILIILIFAAILIHQLDSFDPAPVPFSELTRHLIKKAPAQNPRIFRGAEGVLKRRLLFLYLQVLLITTCLLFSLRRKMEVVEERRIVEVELFIIFHSSDEEFIVVELTVHVLQKVCEFGEGAESSVSTRRR